LVDFYIALNGHLGTAAKAVDMTPRAAGTAMKRPEVKAYLENRQALLSAAVTAIGIEAVSTLIEHMRSDIADIFPDDPTLQAAKAAGVSHLIKKIKIIESGKGRSMRRRVEIELHDSQKAAVHLAKIFGVRSEEQLQMARNAIKLYCELKNCSPEIAIVDLAPHIPGVFRVRQEFGIR